MGISRIMKESAVPGARFDLVIHPTYANSNVPAPNVTIPSEYHLYHYDVEIDGKKAEFIEREKGVIEITLNRKEGVIIIYRDEK